MEWIYRIYHIMQSPLIGIINNKSKKEEPGNEKPLFIGIAQYAFLYDLCYKLKQDNGQ